MQKSSRFTEPEFHKTNLTPIAGYWVYPLVSLEKALESVLPIIYQLNRSIKEAKKHCHYPSKHGLTHDESAAVFLYTVEADENSFYRILNKTLQEEDRNKVKPWFPYLKLFDEALSKLPTVSGYVWRGVVGDIGKEYKENALITWWSISSCSTSVDVVKEFLDPNQECTLFMIDAVNGKNITGYSNYSNEKEVILTMGTKLRVIEMGFKYGNLRIVRLKEVDGIVSEESIQFQWVWQSNNDPWSTDEEPQFTAYPSNINQIIESAYSNDKSEVVISRDYKIDFKSQIQINLHDVTRQRPIIREEMGSSCRKERTTKNIKRSKFSAKSARTFDVDTKFHGCKFIADWYNRTLERDNSKLVTLTINGILTEAKSYSNMTKAMVDADRFAAELRKVQHAKELYIIQEVCVRLYIQDTFLRRIINQTLRNNNSTKSETLGPFCYLLYNYTGNPKTKQDKLSKKIALYRCELLTPQVIEELKLTVGSNKVWKWTQFISTSKKRCVAEQYGDGKSLFIIEMDPSASNQGVYIAPISPFPNEDEFLLRPGVRFTVTKIEQENDSQRQLLFINILPSDLEKRQQDCQIA